MKTRRNIIVIAAFIAVGAVGVVVVANRTAEPTWQGRTLSSWLDDVQGWDKDGSAPAGVAFGSMGTNALPFLVDHVVSRQSRWRYRSYYLFQTMGWMGLRDLAGKKLQRKMAAERVLISMGSDATNALPFILSGMRSDRDGELYWADGLMAVIIADPNVIPAVINEVREPRHRSSLCGVLGMARVDPETSIAFLTEQLEDEDLSVRKKALRALSRFSPKAEGASEVGRPLMEEADPGIRAEPGGSHAGGSSEPAG